MTDNEEVKIKFGGDTSGVAQALRGLKSVVEDSLHSVKDYFSDITKGFLGAAGIEKGVDLIKEGIQKALESVKQIDRISEATGLDAETWQKFAFTLSEVGAGAETGEKWVTKLAATLAEAKSGIQASVDVFQKWGIAVTEATTTAQLLDEIGARMDSLVDPTQKAAMATEIFGKGAAKAVAALKEWREFHGSGAAILTDADIEGLKQANIQLEKLENRLTVYAGKLLALGEKHRAAFGLTGLLAFGLSNKTPSGGESGGAAPSGFTPINPEYVRLLIKALEVEATANAESVKGQEKIKALEKERAEIEARLNSLKHGSTDEANAYMELAKKDVELAKEKKALAEAEVELNRQLRDSRLQIADIDRRRAEHLNATIAAPSLEQLAARARWVPGFQLEQGHYAGGAAYALAANIRDEKEWLFNLRMYSGTQDPRFKKLAERIQGQEKTLSDAGYISPDTSLDEINKAATATANHLSDLLKMANEKGIPVQPSNGQ